MVEKNEPQRCASYCTASAYDIAPLFQALQPQGPTQLLRDVIHHQIKEDKKVKGDIFFFSYGVAVFWGFAAEQEHDTLSRMKGFEREPHIKGEIDEFTYILGEAVRIEEDEIALQNKNPLTKLAISYGIAQSVKLTIFEEMIQRTIERTKTLPHDLAHRGKIRLSRKSISRMMGEIFLERNFVNLHSEMLDTPEFFWDHPELEPFYRRTAHYLDISRRVEVLNKRLNVMHELYEIMTSELHHMYSIRLEITIVVLILIEVLMAVLRDIFRLI